MTSRDDPPQPKDQEVVFGLGWFDRAQWQRLTEVVEDRAELDDTYEQWEQGANDAMRKFERQGQKVEKVHIDVQALVSWCKAKGLPINGKSRSEYVTTVLRERNGLSGRRLIKNAGLRSDTTYRRRRIRSGGIKMSQSYTAVIKQDGDWWIGWIEEVPGVNCQEHSREELLKTLRVTLAEALEMNRTDARDAAGKGYEELSIAV